MKKINCFVIVLLQVFAFQAVGQSVLNDGRDVSLAPSTPVVAETNVIGDQMRNGSDMDVPGEAPVNVAKEDMYYPVDIEILREELDAGATAPQVIDQINGLTNQVEALVQANEQLREENRLIRKSLSACCSSGNMGLSANDAYLVQNAPNPFTQFSEIRYFVPEGVGVAELEIRDVKGELVQSYPLEVTGYGKVNIGDNLFQTGTYVYSLNIGGKVIDSKVMILTK
ncbi:MAG: T9SS type A sorting domain-containing protein [Bacteroidota bacterium]